MNSTGKFLVSALLVHAANMKKLSETQQAVAVPETPNCGSSQKHLPAGTTK